jgi:predicted peptidase
MLKHILLATLGFHALVAAQLTKFQARTQKGKSGLLVGYRLFTPAGYDKAKKYPLVLALHGAGEVGSNNTTQITANRLAPRWTDDTLQARVPHFVLAPQCPGESTWVKYNKPLAGRPLSGPLTVVLEIVDSLSREFSLDADRIYCVGLSMGGYATWELAQRFPTRFAAVVPICGWADVTEAAVLKSLPIWAFHGDIDPTVPVAGSRNIIAAIKAAGGTPKYTEYPGVGHDSWVKAMEEKGLPPWLFEQIRGSTTRLQASASSFKTVRWVPAFLTWKGTLHRPDGKAVGE